MELNQIQQYLNSPDAQNRMKAIVELRNYSPAVVVPLLKQRMYDRELLIRSFVAIGLGKKQNEEAFDALLDIIEYDRDHNVIAEAANSLAHYGERAIPYLVRLFQQKPHWLVRQSILAALEGEDYPETLLQLCVWGLEGDDLVVKLGAIACLNQLATTSKASAALDLLLNLINSEQVEIRAQVARTLHAFNCLDAKTALAKLRQDSDYRVVGATLEGLI
ncbi:HEAT repeat domain-containing protein [Gloeocapsa sp. PCC 73106]|uniref:HEAT repeat domain-containing protein n=1 Tax=Gloeocapsa sp. PCC 73106 TaxID=102232 RepID=UPI0002AC5DC8|nr:HEAT repeat domain-containing protein [Gloeocapsa sp. PCC 73106]ELR99218.1 hypothetical protein GLO73106DRAFT_00030680 [Gloeocapsa sp. PCC 73106]